ncbi:dynamin family protein [Sulfurovum sp.]|uniref:dynamin family protein n=1 Tax=Sulfurovum sp. TaxID=1969726 RepID=UPI0025FCAB8D|nr:dynamin family protein [Sulfurovum sp.]
MLNTQIKYIDYISKVNDEIEKTNLPDKVIEKFQLKETIEAIEKVELLVPVIGAFSAGKSSLLNSFLGDKKLPEKITPETALATELRYSEDEHIEAVGANSDITTFSIDDIEEIKDRAKDFKYLRMYLKNENIKNIEPLILVDMPGFESPLDLHNQAIMEYINRGVHYIVLSSVEDGTITKSMRRQLENIQAYERGFSFFLSKTNLKPKEEVEEIKQQVQDQLEDYFDITNEIGLVDDNGGESLQRVLSKIDPEQLIKTIFLEDLKDNYFSIKEAINTSISASGKTKEENNRAIQQLQKALDETLQKKNNLIEETKSRYSDIRINAIVEAVSMDLSNSIEEIVSVGMSGDSNALSETILEIAKSSLIVNVKDSMNDISGEIVNDFSTGLSNLNSVMADFTISENWIAGIAETTKKMITGASNKLNTIVSERKKVQNNNEDIDKTYKAVTSVLAITTEVVNPIVEVAIVFLPEILSFVFAAIQENKQKEKIRTTILTTTIPSLKRNLRAKLPEMFNAQVNELISQIGEQFEEAIENKQASIENAQKEREEENRNMEQIIQTYKKADKAITTLANNTLYKE